MYRGIIEIVKLLSDFYVLPSECGIFLRCFKLIFL